MGSSLLSRDETHRETLLSLYMIVDRGLEDHLHADAVI